MEQGCIIFGLHHTHFQRLFESLTNDRLACCVGRVGSEGLPTILVGYERLYQPYMGNATAKAFSLSFLAAQAPAGIGFCTHRAGLFDIYCWEGLPYVQHSVKTKRWNCPGRGKSVTSWNQIAFIGCESHCLYMSWLQGVIAWWHGQSSAYYS